MSPRARVLALMALWWTAQASAQADGATRLSWVRGAGAEACPRGGALEAEVSRRLGRNPFNEPAAQELEGVVRRDEHGSFRAVLYERDGAGALLGTRELSSAGPSCDGLTAAVVLALALAIDPDAALAPAAPAAPPAPVVAPTPEEAERPSPPPVRIALSPPVRITPPRVDAPSAPSSRRNAPAVRVRLGALLAWQLLPGFSPGLSLDVDGRARGPLRWLVGMRYAPEQSAGDLSFGLTAAHGGACLRQDWGRLSAGGCAALAFGALHAVSHELDPVDPGDRFYGSALVSAEAASMLFGPLFLSVSAGLELPFVRYRFRLEGRDAPVFEEPPAIPQAVIGAGLRFP